RTQASLRGPELVFGHSAPQKPLLDIETAEHFRISEKGVVATDGFSRAYDEGRLRVILRDDVRPIEDTLEALVPVLDGGEGMHDLLHAWSVSAGGKLGLDHFEHALCIAREALVGVLDVLKRRDEPSLEDLRGPPRPALAQV